MSAHRDHAFDPGPDSISPTGADEVVDAQDLGGVSASSVDASLQDLAEAASTEVTGAPTAQLAAHPATGVVHARAAAPARGVNDVPPAARRRVTDSVTLPSRVESSAWAAPDATDRVVRLLDAAIVDGVVDDEMLARGVDVALDERDWSGLAAAATAVSDPGVAAALAYMAAVTAWRVGADCEVATLARAASWPGVGVHPLVVARTTRLRPARTVETGGNHSVTVRLPVSDRTVEVLACWPDQPQHLPAPDALAYPLAVAAVSVGAAAGVDLHAQYLPDA